MMLLKLTDEIGRKYNRFFYKLKTSGVIFTETQIFGELQKHWVFSSLYSFPNPFMGIFMYVPYRKLPKEAAMQQERCTPKQDT